MSLLESSARPYQLEDAQRIALQWGGRGILGHKTGLGKTFIALLVWELLGKPPRTLVAGTNSAIAVWKRLIPRWVECQPQHITGSSYERPTMWHKASLHSGGPQFVLVNHDILRRDKASIQVYKPDLIIVDEAHKVLRSRKTVTYGVLKQLASRHILIASATLASRGPQDLWPSLNLVQPKLFPSYWRFINQYCFVTDTPFGKQVFGSKNPQGLHTLLRDKCSTWRSYEEVLSELPPVTREPVELEMLPEQQKVYKDLDRDMVALIKAPDTEETRLLKVPNVLSKVVRLRQLLVCPKILGLNMPSAGLEYLKDAVEEEPHTVIFCVFAAAIPFIVEELSSVAANGIAVFRGGMSPDEVNAAESKFKANRQLAICSVAFAQSFSLDTVHNAYFLGFSWDPTENEQAEGRLRRLDSKNFQGVNVQYLVHKGTVDENVREVLNGKTITVHSFMRDIQSKTS